MSHLRNVLSLRLTKSPIVALAVTGGTALTRDFNEALVKTQIVTDAVLPALLVLLVVRELFRYVTGNKDAASLSTFSCCTCRDRSRENKILF